MKWFGLAVLIGLVACVSVARGETAPRRERQVSVSGNGKVSAVPDQAQLRIEVISEGARVEEVNKEVRGKMEAVLKALRGQGLPDKDIQTQFYRVSPKMEWRNGRSILNGYTVSNQVMATVRDMKKVGAVLAAALDAGANNVHGPEFGFENPQQLERKAMALAVEDASAKAALLAQTAGASLGEVISLQEGAVYQPGPRPVMMRATATMDRAAEEPIVPGEETVRANVTATFSLK